MKKELGKIQEIFIGHGGYDNAMIGLHMRLGGEGWGVSPEFQGAWSGQRSIHAKWTEESRIEHLGKMMMFIDDLLAQAKVKRVEELKGVPVECSFDGMKLESWRILKEVL